MLLCLLPVLPLELRPIIQIDGGKPMSSDINELYRRIIYKNKTLIDPLTTSRSTLGESVMCQKKLLQEAVDTLLDNGICGQPMRDGHNKVYKSFSDVIDGKEGRFRETQLGKWVDYSSHSIIVVGPSLSLHQCGLPRNKALSDICNSTWEILQKVMEGHPLLLNREPTLHRLTIQAFQPILVEGCAICLHPLVRKGFNTDFDGGSKARLLMFSHRNLLSPAIGDPIFVPTQDTLIGLYVLTIGNRRGICTNRYNPCNHINYQKEIVDDNNFKYTKEKEPSFLSKSWRGNSKKPSTTRALTRLSLVLKSFYYWSMWKKIHIKIKYWHIMVVVHRVLEGTDRCGRKFILK
ncbi:hypothetical protein AMTRI_Chr08g205010 [Amborella trichopoda]